MRVRLHLREAPRGIELRLLARAPKQPTYEFVRCRGSCDIAISPGRYQLKLTDSPETRAGTATIEIKDPGTYTIRPAARDTLLSGALLAVIGQPMMGAGIGLTIGHGPDSGDESQPMFYAGAGLFSLGVVTTAAGFYLYSDRPRLNFSKGFTGGDVDRASAEAVTSSGELPYQDGQGVPPGYRLQTRPRKGLLTTGIILFGASYGVMTMVAAAATAEEGSDRLERLFIPVIGPALVEQDSDDRRAWLLFGAAPQATGVLLIALGAMSERTTLVPLADVDVTPVVSSSGGGVVVGGSL